MKRNLIIFIVLILLFPLFVWGFGNLIDRQIDVVTPPSGTVTLKNNVAIDSSTADSVLYVNGSKVLTSSAVNSTELNFIDGLTQNAQTALDSKEPLITTLPISKGGTNSSTALSGSFSIISNGTSIVEFPLVSTQELSFIDGLTQNAQTALNAKLESVDLTADVTGVLPIVNGGTNSSSVLSNNLVMISVGGAIIESSTTTQELAYLNNVTQDIQTALNAKAQTPISLTADVSGILPIANGGTNSSTATQGFDNLSPTTTKGDIIVYDGTGNVRLPVGTNTQVLSANSATSTGLEWVAAGAGTIEVAFIQDVQTGGTNGGSASGASFNTRVLNTLTDPDSIVTSLSSNQFTLPSGQYYISGCAPAYQTDDHQASVYNTTDAAYNIVGGSSFSSNLNEGMSWSCFEGRLNLASSKTFEIRHYTNTAQASNGLGTAVTTGSTSEVYTYVTIIKY